MKIDIFALCDGVYCYENKLTVVGAYDVLNLPNLTATPVSLNIAAHIIFEAEECGDNMISIVAEDMDSGMKVMELKNPLDISPRESVGTGVLNVALSDVPVIFPKTGKYKFTLAIEGRGSAETFLNVLIAS